MFDAKLPCAFCDPIKTFSDFGVLAEHVKRAHPEIRKALETVTPTEPGEALPSAPENEPEPWEEHGWFMEDEMLPAAGEPRQAPRNRGGGGRGKSSASGGGGGLPYLNSDMLSMQPKEAKILMVRNEPNHRFGPSVVVKLAFEGRSILWTLNIDNNPNFGILLNQFGRDENDWVDKKILLGLERDEFSESYLIRATFAEDKKKK